MQDSLRIIRRAEAHSGVALPVLAAALALGVPQVTWAQEAPVADNEIKDPTAPDQTAADPEGPTQIQSSDEEAVDRSAADQGEDANAIVVTGTLLRGAPPVGSNLISVGEDRIQSQGATTSNELLATVPQVTNLFNTVPGQRLNVAVNQIQVVRPNLRNLAPETSSAASTLVLFDGHRIAGVGVTQTSIDPDLIPTGAIERVEVVTDGGSATYGADAVGGVINFITRKRFDGVKVDARYGFADDYYTADAGITAGKDWGSGSLFGSFSHQRNDALFGRDRDFIRQVNWNDPALTPRGRTCLPGNVVVGGTSFALPNRVANTFNACDVGENASVVPKARRYGAIVGLHQELSDSITVDLRAFYGERSSTAFSPFALQQAVTGGQADNPATPQNEGTTRQAFYVPVGANPTATQTVQIDFSDVLGPNPLRSLSSFEEWGANAEFAVDLTDNWRVRQLFNYSRSNSEFHIFGPLASALNAAATSTNPQTAINFYNPAATSNLDLIRALLNTETNAGQGKDSLFNLRTIADGTLFTLPGGEVKLAAGYEYLHEGFQQRQRQNIVAGGLSAFPYGEYNRRVHSLFAEAQVPIFGADNRLPGIYSLVLAGSVRHDRFSDFGNTTNPKIGLTYKPIEWLSLRGNYSTSFNAPSPVEQLRSLTPNVQRFPFVAAARPGDVLTPAQLGANTLALMGASDELQPQTADTYSIGIDIDPPFLEGLHASLSYYNVEFKGLLAGPPVQNPGLLFGQFPNLVTVNPTFFTATPNNVFLTQFLGVAPNAPAELGPLIANNAPIVYEFIDFRTGNFGQVKVSGLDFAANYRTSTGFGGFDLGVSGNYQLKRRELAVVGGTEIDRFEVGPANQTGVSRLQLQAVAGVDVGNLRAQATLNHSSGFPVLRSSTLPQDRVKAFNVVNLFFKYDVPGESLLLRDLSFTLNVNNVFDQDPPLFRATTGSSSSGFTNGFTLGRLIQFGVSKKF